MKVFVSWGGERTRLVAIKLGEWLGDVLQKLEAWVSVKDIEKGARWANEVSTQNMEKLIARRLLDAGTVTDVRTTGKPDGSFVYEIELITLLDPVELRSFLKSVETMDGVAWVRLGKVDLT